MLGGDLVQPTGSAAALSSTASVMSTFTADKAGLYIASLVVNNTLADSDPDTTVITISSGSSEAPVANAGADIAASDCMNSTLDGSGSYGTESSSELQYLWSIQSKPVVEAGAGSTVAGGDADCEESGYTYDCDDCTTQTVTIGADASISDGDGDPYTYTWSVVSGDITIADASSLVTTVQLAIDYATSHQKA